MNRQMTGMQKCVGLKNDDHYLISTTYPTKSIPQFWLTTVIEHETEVLIAAAKAHFLSFVYHIL